jgi:hypothetical protein
MLLSVVLAGFDITRCAWFTLTHGEHRCPVPDGNGRASPPGTLTGVPGWKRGEPRADGGKDASVQSMLLLAASVSLSLATFIIILLAPVQPLEPVVGMCVTFLQANRAAV